MKYVMLFLLVAGMACAGVTKTRAQVLTRAAKLARLANDPDRAQALLRNARPFVATARHYEARQKRLMLLARLAKVQGDTARARALARNAARA